MGAFNWLCNAYEYESPQDILINKVTSLIRFPGTANTTTNV